MAGLTLEQLQKMGAIPKSSGVVLSQKKEQTFGQRIAEDVAKRQEKTFTGVEAYSQGKQTLPETAIQAVGQSAGLVFDVAGEALRSIVDKIPEAIKKPVKEVATSALNTPLGQAGIKALSNGVEIYNEWKKGNPRTARDLEAIVNIGMLLPTGKITGAVGKEALSTSGELAGRVATKLESGLVKQSLDEAIDIIKPTLSKVEKTQALEAGRGIVTQKILPRKFEKIALAPTKRELEMADVVSDVVSKSKNPIDNIQAIQNKIAETAKSVQEGLKENDTIFNRTQIQSVLNKAKQDSKIVFGSDKTLQNSYDSVVGEMMRQINNQPKNLSGLLQARKNFDTIIDLKFPKLLNNPVGDTAKQNAVKDVRKSVNQFIADQLPEGNVFKEELKKQNLMYGAIENISKKTANNVDASAVKKAMAALRQNPLVSGVTGGILTYGALMGMFSNPIVIGTLIGGGTIALGKSIITSKILRQSLISVLRTLEKAGKIADAGAIKYIISQLPNK